MSMNDSDLIERLHAVAQGFQMPPTPPSADLWRGRRRVRRNRGLVAAAAAAAVAVVIGVTAAVGGQDHVEPAPIEQPNQPDTGIFADIHGWIVYSWNDGIWAVNPSRPADQEPKLVTDRPGQPLGWSSDGTKLLIRTDGGPPAPKSEYDLVVLEDDGTEHRIATNEWLLDGSISPDGSEVVYADPFSGHPGIFIVGAEGGTPRLLHANEAYFPVFSPDGTQIAFFNGSGDWGHKLRVMNADGTDIRTVRDFGDAAGHVRRLAWLPDGEHLMFSGDGVAGGGISVIGVDGSGLTKWAGDDFPAWSPDGSRISYEQGGTLWIADANGTQETFFTQPHLSGDGTSTWNPLPLEGGAE
jgi:hypothetical protein